jgi:hypothetical protein
LVKHIVMLTAIRLNIKGVILQILVVGNNAI